MHSIEDYNGLGRVPARARPVFTLFLLAQAGVPFTAGFLAKFGVIAAAADRATPGRRHRHGHRRDLGVPVPPHRDRDVLRGVDEHGDGPALAGPRVRIPARRGIAIALAVVGTLWLGIVPGPITRVANDAVAQLVAAAP